MTEGFQTQENKVFRLSMLKGKPTVVGMIFNHCTYACPRLTADINNIEDSLKNEKEKLNFLLISFDTKRDTQDRLNKFADEMGLNKNWILLHGSEDAVRTLSILLNVQFEKDAEDNFSHGNLVSVLNKNGVLQYQKEGLGAVHAETITTIKKLIQQR
ncbi:MAG: SCO family protein [Ignavibacteria bacterium]